MQRTRVWYRALGWSLLWCTLYREHWVGSSGIWKSINVAFSLITVTLIVTRDCIPSRDSTLYKTTLGVWMKLRPGAHFVEGTHI